MAEKGRVIKCGCEHPNAQHEQQDGRVNRVQVDGAEEIFVSLLEGNEVWAVCYPEEAIHVHSSDCYANGHACMNQPFGAITRRT